MYDTYARHNWNNITNIIKAPSSVVPNFFFFLLMPVVGLPPELKMPGCRVQSRT